MVHAERIVIIGARSIDAGEMSNLRRAGVRVYDNEHVERFGVRATVGDAMGYLAANQTRAVHLSVDLDVLDPREVMGHGNKVPNGPSSEQLAALFEAIFSRYPKAAAIGFATIPVTDEGGLSLAALNRMIAGAVRGVKARESRR